MSGDVLVVGKIPGEREYVRTEATVFDEWLTAGFERAIERHGIAWEQAFSRGHPCIMLWREEDPANAALFGVVAPSRDAVGRVFPVAVLARIPRAHARFAHLLFLAYADFLQAADCMIMTAQHGCLSGAEVAALAGRLGPPTPSDVSRTAEEYEVWCETTSVKDACAQLFSDAAARTKALAALAAMRGVRVIGPRCLPLGEASEISAAALWLDATNRLSRRGPSAFWRTLDASLIVTEAAPPAALVEDLWPLAGPAASESGCGARSVTLPAAATFDETIAEYLAALRPSGGLRECWARAWSRG